MSRKLSVLLTVLSLSSSIFLLLSIEKIRYHTKTSFETTVSQTDLIVGARGGPLQLLLYSVFGIGNPSNNIRWSSYQHFKSLKDVKWSFPISLGDSHKGFRVIGTTDSFFKYYKYGAQRELKISAGDVFSHSLEVVIGSDVAEELHYTVGQKIVLAHGMSENTLFSHEDHPFVISGILSKTATPVDRAVYVSLESLEMIHEGWESGVPPNIGGGQDSDHEDSPVEIKAISAFFVGLNSKFSILSVQRDISNFRGEPLTAIIPSLTLRNFWKTLSFVEKTLMGISILVLLVSLTNMLLMLLNSLESKRREVAIYRALGASKFFIFLLMLVESLFYVILSVIFSFVLLLTSTYLFKDLLLEKLGVEINVFSFTSLELIYLGVILFLAMFISIFPAIWVYRRSLSDGLMVKG